MDKKEAFEILKKNISSSNLIKHSLALEAVMRQLAQYFKEDEEKWGISGILHDIDYEKVKDDLSQHSLLGAKILEDLGVDQDIVQAVKVHNEAHGIEPETLMEKALFVSDPLTGLIVASTLVLPSKKIKDLTVENVINRFGEKSFAKGANREVIKQCEILLGLTLAQFAEIGLRGMQGISEELGL